MPKPNLQPLNIGSVARGALLELFEANVAKVVENISDTSTKAETPRTIVLKLRFKPDQDRRVCQVTTTGACQLAAIAEHTSRAYVGKDTEGHAYLFDQDPRQDVLFEAPAADENLLNFKTNTSN